MPLHSKLTAAMIKTIAGHVANGLTNQDACLLAGISDRTLRRWLEKAADAESGLYLELAEAMKRAEAGFKQTHLAIIIKAASQPATQNTPGKDN